MELKRVKRHTITNVHVVRVRVALHRVFHEAFGLLPASLMHGLPEFSPGIAFWKHELEYEREKTRQHIVLCGFKTRTWALVTFVAVVGFRRGGIAC